MMKFITLSTLSLYQIIVTCKLGTIVPSRRRRRARRNTAENRTPLRYRGRRAAFSIRQTWRMQREKMPNENAKRTLRYIRAGSREWFDETSMKPRQDLEKSPGTDSRKYARKMKNVLPLVSH